MAIAEKILNRLNISKPQKKFLITLFTTILIARGKINFRNLSRYSHLCERTYTRHFDKPFSFMDFNRAIINESIDQDQDQDQAHGRILVLDASFVPKSGKKTYGLDHFWNGCQSRREKGLEILGVALVDVDKNTGFTLSVCQTVPKTDTAKGKKTTATKTNKNAQTEDETRIDQYLAHLREVHPCLEADETYLAVEGKFKSTYNSTDRIAKLRANTFFALIGIADLDHSPKSKPSPPTKTPDKSKTEDPPPASPTERPQQPPQTHESQGPPPPPLPNPPSLHYNIQIHLPATKDLEVYNAIFKSLKEHLLE